MEFVLDSISRGYMHDSIQFLQAIYMLPLSHYFRMLLLPTSLPKTNSKFAPENGCLEYELGIVRG